MNPVKVFRDNLRRKTRIEVTLSISPELATLMLRQNTQNRPVRRAGVVDCVNEINAGRFVTTAHGIAFDRRGVLVDGQHRLFAIIEAAQSVEMVVVFGLDPDARIAVDVDGRVNDGTMLEMAGLTHGDMRAAIAKLHLIFAKKSARRRFAAEEIEAEARLLGPELDFIAGHYRELTRLGLRAPLLTALAVALRKDAVKTKEFVDKLVSFQRSGPNDPLVRFERLVKHVPGRSREELFCAGLRCLRGYFDNEPLERVRTAQDELVYFAA